MHLDSNAPTDAELAAYLAGTIASRRRAEIEQWIAGDRAHATRVEELRTALGAELPSDSWNRARIWGNIEAAIERNASAHAADAAATPDSTAAAARKEARRRLIATLGGVAAALVVIVAGATYIVDSLPAHAELSAPREYATRRGQRATVQLSDGSRVVLAPESRLRVAEDFGHRRRSVELEGEAQFDVVHDSTREFSVHAGAALVVDIGTRFDLRAYRSDTAARVAVSEGAVAMRRFVAMDAAAVSSEGVLVRQGEVGQLDAGGHARTVAMDDPSAYFAWTADQLVFRRARLRDVLETVAHWSTVDIRVADSTLADRLITAEFATTSATDMANALASALNAKAVDSGRTITLVPR